MGLRDLLNKGKCLIGLHEGAWIAPSPTVCTYTRRCVRCGAEHTKVEHPWGDWRFVATDACDQQRACPRCDLHEQRVLHSYGTAAFVADDRCDREERCARCHATRALPPLHAMTLWRFVEDDDCRQVQQCSRCRLDGTVSRTEHSWGDWQSSDALRGTVRVCRRCGELQVEPAPQPAVVGSVTVQSAATGTDSPLVGHWRHTDVMSGGGFSLVTDTHLVLESTGRLRRWTHSASTMGEQTSAPERGTWRAADGVLYSSDEGGPEVAMRYTVTEDALLFPDAGTQRLWERVS